MENIYYTEKPKNIQVTKDEFIKFIESYPRPLIKDVCGICDPPSISYNDFELADKWPYSIVARTFAYDDNEDGFFYISEEQRKYSIMSNYKDVFDSKLDKQEVKEFEKELEEKETSPYIFTINSNPTIKITMGEKTYKLNGSPFSLMVTNNEIKGGEGNAIMAQIFD